MVRILLPIVACELLIFAIPPVVERLAVNADGSSQAGSYGDNTTKALAFIRQYDHGSDFYRIDKTFYSVFLADPLAEDYPGTSSYYFHGASMTRFVDSMGLPRVTPSPNYISSMADRRAVLDLVGVKYIITGDRRLDAEPDMQFIDDSTGFTVYENKTAHGFARFYDAMATEAQANAIPQGAQRDIFVRDHVIVPDVQFVQAHLAALDRESSAQTTSTTEAHIRKIRDDSLEGSLQTPTARVLLLSMPFDRGWSASLDDAGLDLFRADYGLTGALIPPGTHRLQLQYSPPGRVAGWWCAVAAVLLLLAMTARRRFVRTAFEPAAAVG
jgi:uncharacterized membrane protein YfhO